MLHRLGLVGSAFEEAAGDGCSVGAAVRERMLADDASCASSPGASVNTVRNIDVSARAAKENRMLRAQAERDTDLFSHGRKLLSISYAYE